MTLSGKVLSEYLLFLSFLSPVFGFWRRQVGLQARIRIFRQLFLHCHESVWKLDKDKNVSGIDKKVEFGRLISSVVTIASQKHSDSSFLQKNLYRFKNFHAF